jgi:hypothetical protein
MGFLKKITRPVTKVLDKLVPNEIKPFLPYAAAAAPFLLPAGATIGGLSPAMTRALISGGSSALASGAEEGAEGIDFKTALLSAGLGYLSDPTAAKNLERFRTPIPSPGDTGVAGGELGFLDTAKNVGITGLQKASEFLSTPSKGIKDFAGKYAVTGGIEGTGQAIRFAERAAEAEQAALDEFNRLVEENAAATYDDYYNNILKYMDLAGFTAEEAEAAAERTLRGVFAKGGRVGYSEGGDANNKDVTPPGMEMDLRVGGFIPIGKAERADDVKARVGLNEFVMTADAVRGMGNGDVREGARRMYQLMDKLEPIGKMA